MSVRAVKFEELTALIQHRDVFLRIFFIAKVTDENFWPFHKSEC